MKRGVLFLAAVLTLSMPGWGQQEDQQQQEQQQHQQEAPRPTLGPPPSAPSLGGPRNSTTNDARRLLRIRTIYIERIDNSLSDKLADGLTKKGLLRVVESRKQADAVLRGTCFDSRRLKSVHAEVFISDVSSGASIWQDIVRQHYNPPPLSKVIDDTAALIVTHLTESIQEAQRK